MSIQFALPTVDGLPGGLIHSMDSREHGTAFAAKVLKGHHPQSKIPHGTLEASSNPRANILDFTNALANNFPNPHQPRSSSPAVFYDHESSFSFASSSPSNGNRSRSTSPVPASISNYIAHLPASTSAASAHSSSSKFFASHQLSTSTSVPALHSSSQLNRTRSHQQPQSSSDANQQQPPRISWRLSSSSASSSADDNVHQGSIFDAPPPSNSHIYHQQQQQQHQQSSQSSQPSVLMSPVASSPSSTAVLSPTQLLAHNQAIAHAVKQLHSYKAQLHGREKQSLSLIRQREQCVQQLLESASLLQRVSIEHQQYQQYMREYHPELLPADMTNGSVAGVNFLISPTAAPKSSASTNASSRKSTKQLKAAPKNMGINSNNKSISVSASAPNLHQFAPPPPSIPLNSVQQHLLNSLVDLRRLNLDLLESIDAWQQLHQTIQQHVQTNNLTQHQQLPLSLSSSSSDLLSSKPILQTSSSAASTLSHSSSTTSVASTSPSSPGNLSFIWNGYDYICKMLADVSSIDEYSAVYELIGYSLNENLFVLPSPDCFTHPTSSPSTSVPNLALRPSDQDVARVFKLHMILPRLSPSQFAPEYSLPSSESTMQLMSSLAHFGVQPKSQTSGNNSNANSTVSSNALASSASASSLPSIKSSSNTTSQSSLAAFSLPSLPSSLPLNLQYRTSAHVRQSEDEIRLASVAFNSPYANPYLNPATFADAKPAASSNNASSSQTLSQSQSMVNLSVNVSAPSKSPFLASSPSAGSLLPLASPSSLTLPSVGSVSTPILSKVSAKNLSSGGSQSALGFYPSTDDDHIGDLKKSTSKKKTSELMNRQHTASSPDLHRNSHPTQSPQPVHSSHHSQNVNDNSHQSVSLDRSIGSAAGFQRRLLKEQRASEMAVLKEDAKHRQSRDNPYSLKIDEQKLYSRFLSQFPPLPDYANVRASMQSSASTPALPFVSSNSASEPPRPNSTSSNSTSSRPSSQQFQQRAFASVSVPNPQLAPITIKGTGSVSMGNLGILSGTDQITPALSSDRFQSYLHDLSVSKYILDDDDINGMPAWKAKEPLSQFEMQMLAENRMDQIYQQQQQQQQQPSQQVVASDAVAHAAALAGLRPGSTSAFAPPGSASSMSGSSSGSTRRSGGLRPPSTSASAPFGLLPPLPHSGLNSVNNSRPASSALSTMSASASRNASPRTLQASIGLAPTSTPPTVSTAAAAAIVPASSKSSAHTKTLASLLDSALSASTDSSIVISDASDPLTSTISLKSLLNDSSSASGTQVVAPVARRAGGAVQQKSSQSSMGGVSLNSLMGATSTPEFPITSSSLPKVLASRKPTAVLIKFEVSTNLAVRARYQSSTELTQQQLAILMTSRCDALISIRERVFKVRAQLHNLFSSVATNELTDPSSSPTPPHSSLDHEDEETAADPHALFSPTASPSSSSSSTSTASSSSSTMEQAWAKMPKLYLRAVPMASRAPSLSIPAAAKGASATDRNAPASAVSLASESSMALGNTARSQIKSDGNPTASARSVAGNMLTSRSATTGSKLNTARSNAATPRRADNSVDKNSSQSESTQAPQTPKSALKKTPRSKNASPAPGFLDSAPVVSTPSADDDEPSDKSSVPPTEPLVRKRSASIASAKSAPSPKSTAGSQKNSPTQAGSPQPAKGNAVRAPSMNSVAVAASSSSPAPSDILANPSTAPRVHAAGTLETTVSQCELELIQVSQSSLQAVSGGSAIEFFLKGAARELLTVLAPHLDIVSVNNKEELVLVSEVE